LDFPAEGLGYPYDRVDPGLIATILDPGNAESRQPDLTAQLFSCQPTFKAQTSQLVPHPDVYAHGFFRLSAN
jgi:hypothetical protein